MPATIKWLEHLEASLNGCEITLNDKDLFWDSLRIISNSTQIDDEIQKYIGTHCCLCGSTEDVKVEEGSREWMIDIFCADCRSKREGFYARLKYLVSKNRGHEISTKIRIKFANGDISYCRPAELEFIDGEFFKRSKLQFDGKEDSKERVIIVGADTGLRDKNDERAYDGDIIKCSMENREYGFAGMLIKQSKPFSRGGSHPEWERYLVCHGWGNFPSSLAMATDFEIIGNVAEIDDFKGPGPTEYDYERWTIMKNHKIFIAGQ